MCLIPPQICYCYVLLQTSASYVYQLRVPFFFLSPWSLYPSYAIDGVYKGNTPYHVRHKDPTLPPDNARAEHCPQTVGRIRTCRGPYITPRIPTPIPVVISAFFWCCLLGRAEKERLERLEWEEAERLADRHLTVRFVFVRAKRFFSVSKSILPAGRSAYICH